MCVPRGMMGSALCTAPVSIIPSMDGGAPGGSSSLPVPSSRIEPCEDSAAYPVGSPHCSGNAPNRVFSAGALTPKNPSCSLPFPTPCPTHPNEHPPPRERVWSHPKQGSALSHGGNVGKISGEEEQGGGSWGRHGPAWLGINSHSWSVHKAEGSGRADKNNRELGNVTRPPFS